MSKTCNNCGNILEDDANICSRCGTQYIALQGTSTEQAKQTYQQPFQQPYGQGYQQPYQPYGEQPMGVGSWVGTILLTTCLGIISLILLFIWAFGNDTPIAKKNYCRAMLIVELIGVGLVIVLTIVFSVIFAATGIPDILSNGYHL